MMFTAWPDGRFDLGGREVRCALGRGGVTAADAKVEGEMRTKLERPLKVLEQHLSKNQYILGDRFTVADVNVAGVMSMSRMIDFDYSAYPNVKKWFEACMARPALAASAAL